MIVVTVRRHTERAGELLESVKHQTRSGNPCAREHGTDMASEGEKRSGAHFQWPTMAFTGLFSDYATVTRGIHCVCVPLSSANLT